MGLVSHELLRNCTDFNNNPTLHCHGTADMTFDNTRIDDTSCCLSKNPAGDRIRIRCRSKLYVQSTPATS